MCNSKGKFTLGLFVGAVIGAASVYLSKKENRERLVEDLTTGYDKALEGIDKAKDSVVERYYEAKERFKKCTKELEEETEGYIEEIEEMLEDAE